MINLALMLVLSAEPAAADCPWKEPKEPAHVDATVFGGVELKYSVDPNWFRCAKKAGGTLELTWSVGEGGQLTPLPPVKETTYSAREAVKDLCATPGLKQVQAALKGTGVMEKLDWSSTIVEVYCPKCQWAGDDNMMALHTKALTTAGNWTIDATFDPKWYACAKGGAALELRLFTGATREEVKSAKEPTHVVKGLEGPKVKKAFPYAPLCKGKPKFVGADFSGTGEFRVLAERGRAVYEASCP